MVDLSGSHRLALLVPCPPRTHHQQMMEQEWPREVLKLAPCREARAPDGSLAFRGPRIRMGLHWAAEGTVAQR